LGKVGGGPKRCSYRDTFSFSAWANYFITAGDRTTREATLNGRASACMKSMTNSLGPSKTRIPVLKTPLATRSGTRALTGLCRNSALNVPDPESLFGCGAPPPGGPPGALPPKLLFSMLIKRPLGESFQSSPVTVPAAAPLRKDAPICAGHGCGHLLWCRLQPALAKQTKVCGTMRSPQKMATSPAGCR